MNTKNRTVRTGLAALALATAFAATAGPAAVDVPLTPATPDPISLGDGTGATPTPFAAIFGSANAESAWAEANHLPDFSQLLVALANTTGSGQHPLPIPSGSFLPGSSAAPPCGEGGVSCTPNGPH
ncbi:hypothetical protein ACIRRA_29030 [Nocardia sp. NPDC101769]|uniref:hypothetical protein n=1 Tax=Nocardia sp. NPDC101769 TaxID=3364333 RepID=UPI003830522E